MPTKRGPYRKRSQDGKLSLFNFHISDKEKALLRELSARTGCTMTSVLLQGLRIIKEDLDQNGITGDDIFDNAITDDKMNNSGNF
jgi:hypothetical protein